MPAPSCRECGAPLRFVVMAETGKAMPVNAIPNPAGNVAARWTGERWAAGYVLKAGEQPKPGYKAFRAHWADCRTDEPKKSRSESAAARLF